MECRLNWHEELIAELAHIGDASCEEGRTANVDALRVSFMSDAYREAIESRESMRDRRVTGACVLQQTTSGDGWCRLQQ